MYFIVIVINSIFVREFPSFLDQELKFQPAQGMSMPQPSHGGMIPAQVAGPPQIMPPGPPRMGPATQQALAALTATERIPIGAAKDQYRLLKKKFKFLVFVSVPYSRF